MNRKPLLLFPRPSTLSKTSKSGNRDDLHKPEKKQQINRFSEKLTELERVFKNQTAYLGNNPGNFVAEMIIVFEIAGTIENFFKAVAKTPGMEFLAELQSEFLADQDFFFADKRGTKREGLIGSRLFLTMTNQRALKELLGYWNNFTSGEVFSRNTTKFRTLFEQLKDLRPYGIADRLKDTGLEEEIEFLKREGVDRFHFEIELIYKEDPGRNRQIFNEVSFLLNENNGRVIEGSRTFIHEIGYHAFIAEAPINCFDDISENTDITFLKSQQILFFRPVGQAIYEPLKEDNEESLVAPVLPDPINLNEPVIALFDGLPLENHELLQGRLYIDDPEEYERNYLAENRSHGTTMASLILHGDLSQPNRTSLKTLLYVRPIMKANQNGVECLPTDRLPVDLIHRAVRRMFEGEEGLPPSAPKVKVINFSIGDPHRPFQYNISTWAKLLDWLSFKYNVLFIISAGNKINDLVLDIPERNFDQASAKDIQNEVVKSIIEENFDRKILTPAESINSLTVGASHHDFSIIGNFPQRKNLIECPQILSPISRIGFGYNLSIKPDVLMPGGRKLYRKGPFQNIPGKTLLTIEREGSLHMPPGNQVAIPGLNGSINTVGYTCGTSNSTALTTRLAAQLHEMLVELNLEAEKPISEYYFPVIIKSLLAHGASWGKAKEILGDIIKGLPHISSYKRHILPYTGYGCIDSEKILYCTDHRVTLIGFGNLTKVDGGNAHLYSFPLPSSIGQKVIEKRLAITLAWFSPLNFKTSRYRKAQLFFDNMDANNSLTLTRDVYDFKASQKGTLQHDILTGNNADAFIDGTELTIKVNCREDASGLSNTDIISYGLCVTLEIEENIETTIYDEVMLRLRQRIRPRT